MTALFSLACGALSADERILSFHSDIRIQRDASVLVSETIRVRAEGAAIRRGIFRDFPTHYRDRAGNRYSVTFHVLQVLRDGAPEAYHTEPVANGVRVYIGQASQLLPPGEHEYLLRYRTTRQLGRFDSHDELYWNVTGNGWAFPIDRASATVRLPEPVPWERLRIAAYTGGQGESGDAARWHIASGAEVQFETTARLSPRHGLTVAVGWPKGIVSVPGAMEELGYFLADNDGALALMAGMLLALGWYLVAWNTRGRDPRKGVIIPRFEPPRGLSPAACRYVLDMGLDRRCFTAAVVSLGVKGFLKIDQQGDEFTLFRLPGGAQQEPGPGESMVLAVLLPDEESWITLENENHHSFSEAKAGLKSALEGEFKGRLFNLNARYALPAIVLTGLAVIMAIALTAGLLAWVAFGVASASLHLGFIFLLRAPTPAGRRIMDEIEGFRMYLATAERDRLDRMRSPRLTPEVFERFLPYAFALGVENRWCERFQREFPEYQGAGGAYHPTWYSGPVEGLDAMNYISSGLGNELSSAISSASTPPGSSSGSGGGGFSGGGGGGGGGGGW